MKSRSDFIRGLPMHETGVIHGRFQILHNDHVRYIMAGKSRCKHIVVGVTNPDPTLTRSVKEDSNRSRPLSNPLTYYERYTMIREVLAAEKLVVSEYSIVPFPINLPELYRYYVPLDSVFFLTIYDSWGRKKLSQFQTLGLRTEVLWERPIQEKGITGTDVRRQILRNESWESQVPPAAARLLNKWRVPERLRSLARSS
jgi:nicotinamide-nucleotide adenylyltransferase